jgi:hypothetical protein
MKIIHISRSRIRILLNHKKYRLIQKIRRKKSRKRLKHDQDLEERKRSKSKIVEPCDERKNQSQHSVTRRIERTQHCYKISAERNNDRDINEKEN